MSTIRIHAAAVLLEEELVQRYAQVSVSAVSDSLERRAGAVGIGPVGDCLDALDGATMVGPALTVRTRAGDNLAVHKALDLARPGEVVVVDAGGLLTNAIIGELMAEYAASRGVVGIVVDGAVRDRTSLSLGSLPVFARGVSHLGPYKSGPGEINAPISIGGVVARSGDVILGDADGIAVVPRARAQEALEAAEKVVLSEEAQRTAISEGRWDRTWIDALATVVHVEDD